MEAAGDGDESCADEGAGDLGEVGCGLVHVGVDLVLEAVDLGLYGGEDGGEGLAFVGGVWELAPAGESFGDEVGRLD